MKNAFPIALLAGIVGGVGATVVTKLLSTDSATGSGPEPTLAAGLTPGDDGVDGDLQAELERLRKENDALALRVASLESRPAATREEITTEGSSSEDIAALQEQVLELSAALKNPGSPQSVGLRNMVAAALDDVRDMEDEERRTERQQRDVDRVVERMDEISERLGLDAVQRQSMQDVLIDETTKRSAVFEQMREGNFGRTEIRTAMMELHEETRTQLANILTPTQLETYGEMDSDRGRFGGFGRDRGGDRGSSGDSGGGGERGGRGPGRPN